MKLKLLAIMFFLVPFLLLAKQQNIIGCFSSGGINLKYIELSDNNTISGHVVYARGSKPIPLTFISKSEVTFDNRPSEFTYTWSEVIDDKVNGMYSVVTQGARFNDFYYKSKSNKTTRFKENIEAYNSDNTDCKWPDKR